jgi:energy-coupling factor transport system ATP-binding protein
MFGRVEICGLDTRTQPLAKLATTVNMVFQDPEIGFFCSTVEDEVAFGPRNLGLSRLEVEERVEFALEGTGIENLRARRVIDLSGGEKRRLAIASVLSMKPMIIALDEPTSDLDSEGARSILAVLQSLRTKYGLSIVVAEHRLDHVSQHLNRVVVMDSGGILTDGSPSYVFERQRSLLEMLGVRPPLDEALYDIVMTRPPGIDGSSNGSVTGRDNGTLLRVESVAFSYGDSEVLRDVSFGIGPGELVALLGANGAGKTTVAFLLAGVLKPSRGSVVFNHRGVANGNHVRRVGLLFQNPTRQLFCDSVRQEIEFGPRNTGSPDYVTRAEDVLNLFGLDKYADAHPHHLSEGEKHRVAFASVLAMKPDLLILDEPTTGQNWAHLKALMDRVRDCTQMGMGVLLITHDYRLASEYATRVIVMNQGRIVANGPTRQVFGSLNVKRGTPLAPEQTARAGGEDG